MFYGKGVSKLVNRFRVMADRFWVKVTANRNSADHSQFPYYLSTTKKATKGPKGRKIFTVLLMV
jgi:hypothetical protein